MNRRMRQGYIVSFSLLLLGVSALILAALLFAFYQDNPASTGYVADNLKLILVRRGVENSMRSMFSTTDITLSASDQELGFVQHLPFDTEPFYDAFNAYLNVLNQSDNEMLVRFSVKSMNNNLTVLNQNLMVRYPWSRQIIIQQVSEPDYQSRQLLIDVDTLNENFAEGSGISLEGCGEEGEYCNDLRGMNVTVSMRDALDDVITYTAMIKQDMDVALVLRANNTQTRISFNDTIDVRQYLGEVLLNLTFLYPRENRVIDPHLYLGSPKGGSNDSVVSYKFADYWIADKLLLR